MFVWMIDLLKRIYGGSFAEISPIEFFAFIFVNNSVKSLLIIPLGIIFAIPTFIFIFFNGFLIGVLGYSIGQTDQIGFATFFIGIMPHGIIELTAVFWSSALSLRVGWTVINKLRGKYADIKKEIVVSMRIFARKILPLLFLAALIEAFITPTIMNITGAPLI